MILLVQQIDSNNTNVWLWQYDSNSTISIGWLYIVDSSCPIAINVHVLWLYECTFPIVLIQYNILQLKIQSNSDGSNTMARSNCSPVNFAVNSLSNKPRFLVIDKLAISIIYESMHSVWNKHRVRDFVENQCQM